MKLKQLPQKIWFRSIALALCIVLPLTEITPAFAKTDSEIPLHAALGSGTDADALNRMRDLKFRLNQAFIREHVLSQFTPGEIKQLQTNGSIASGFGAADDQQPLPPEAKPAQQKPQSIFKKWAPLAKKLILTILIYAPPFATLALTGQSLFVAKYHLLMALTAVAFLKPAVWFVKKFLLHKAALFLTFPIFINGALGLGIFMFTVLLNLFTPFFTPDFQGRAVLTAGAFFIYAAFVRAVKMFIKKAPDFKTEIKKLSWGKRLSGLTGFLATLGIYITSVFAHAYFLRYFYVPILYGIFPWAVDLDSGNKVIIHGLLQNSYAGSNLKHVLDMLPARVFDETNPHRIHFYPYPPDIWNHDGFYSHWEWPDSFLPPFLPPKLTTKIVITNKGDGRQFINVLHEQGHHVYFANWFKAQRKRWDELYERYKADTKGFLISEYSLTNAGEGFAEWFKFFVMNNGGPLLLDYLDRADDTQREMWLLIAQLFTEERGGATFLQVNFTETQQRQFVAVQPGPDGKISLEEFRRAVKEAQRKELDRIASSWPFPMSIKEYRKLIEHLALHQDGVVEGELYLAGQLAERNDILNRRFIDAGEEELVSVLTEAVEGLGNNFFGREMAVNFLLKLNNEKSASALLKYLRLSQNDLTLNRVFESLTQMKSPEAKQTISDLLEQVLKDREQVSYIPYELKRLDFSVILHVLSRGNYSMADRTLLQEIIHRRLEPIEITFGKQWADRVYEYLREIDRRKSTGFGAVSAKSLIYYLLTTGAVDVMTWALVGAMALGMFFEILEGTPLGKILYSAIRRSKRAREFIRSHRVKRALKPRPVDWKKLGLSTVHLVRTRGESEQLRSDAGELADMLFKNGVNAHFVFQFFIPRVTAAMNSSAEAHKAIRTLYAQWQNPDVIKNMIRSLYSISFAQHYDVGEWQSDLHGQVFGVVMEGLKKATSSVDKLISTGIKTLDQFFAALYEAAGDREVRFREIDWEPLIQEAYRAVSSGEEFRLEILPVEPHAQIHSIRVIPQSAAGFGTSFYAGQETGRWLYRQIEPPENYRSKSGHHEEALTHGWTGLKDHYGAVLDNVIEALPRDRKVKILVVGAGRGKTVLQIASRMSGRDFEIHSVNKEKNLIYDLPHIFQYLHPGILPSKRNWMPGPDDPRGREARMLFDVLHAHHHVLDISIGRDVEKLPNDFDLIVVEPWVLMYVPDHLKVNEKLFGRLREGGILFTEIRDLQIRESGLPKTRGASSVIEMLKDGLGKGSLEIFGMGAYAHPWANTNGHTAMIQNIGGGMWNVPLKHVMFAHDDTRIGGIDVYVPKPAGFGEEHQAQEEFVSVKHRIIFAASFVLAAAMIVLPTVGYLYQLIFLKPGEPLFLIGPFLFSFNLGLLFATAIAGFVFYLKVGNYLIRVTSGRNFLNEFLNTAITAATFIITLNIPYLLLHELGHFITHRLLWRDATGLIQVGMVEGPEMKYITETITSDLTKFGSTFGLDGSLSILFLSGDLFVMSTLLPVLILAGLKSRTFANQAMYSWVAFILSLFPFNYAREPQITKSDYWLAAAKFSEMFDTPSSTVHFYLMVSTLVFPALTTLLLFKPLKNLFGPMFKFIWRGVRRSKIETASKNMPQASLYSINENQVRQLSSETRDFLLKYSKYKYGAMPEAKEFAALLASAIRNRFSEELDLSPAEFVIVTSPYSAVRPGAFALSQEIARILNIQHLDIKSAPGNRFESFSAIPTVAGRFAERIPIILDAAQAEAIRGKKVLLIDDTVVTGATVQSVRHSLLQKFGAKEVDIFSILNLETKDPSLEEWINTLIIREGSLRLFASVLNAPETLINRRTLKYIFNQEGPFFRDIIRRLTREAGSKLFDAAKMYYGPGIHIEKMKILEKYLVLPSASHQEHFATAHLTDLLGPGMKDFISADVYRVGDSGNSILDETGREIAAHLPQSKGTVFQISDHAGAAARRIIKISKELDSETVIRIAHEAKILFELGRKNVAHVPRLEKIGLLEDGGVWIRLDIDIREGETLENKVFSNPTELFAGFINIANDLRAIHESGFVHNDINGWNILMGESALTRLIDFGLAGRANGIEPRGLYVPEGALGHKREMVRTPSTDVYAFVKTIVRKLDKEIGEGRDLGGKLAEIRQRYYESLVDELGRDLPPEKRPALDHVIEWLRADQKTLAGFGVEEGFDEEIIPGDRADPSARPGEDDILRWLTEGQEEDLLPPKITVEDVDGENVGFLLAKPQFVQSVVQTLKNHGFKILYQGTPQPDFVAMENDPSTQANEVIAVLAARPRSLGLNSMPETLRRLMQYQRLNAEYISQSTRQLLKDVSIMLPHYEIFRVFDTEARALVKEIPIEPKTIVERLRWQIDEMSKDLKAAGKPLVIFSMIPTNGGKAYFDSFRLDVAGGHSYLRPRFEIQGEDGIRGALGSLDENTPLILKIPVHPGSHNHFPERDLPKNIVYTNALIEAARILMNGGLPPRKFILTDSPENLFIRGPHLIDSRTTLGKLASLPLRDAQGNPTASGTPVVVPDFQPPLPSMPSSIRNNDDALWEQLLDEIAPDSATDVEIRPEDLSTGFGTKAIDALRVNGVPLKIVPITVSLVQANREKFFELFKLMDSDIRLDLVRHVGGLVSTLAMAHHPAMSFVAMNDRKEPVATAAFLKDSKTGRHEKGESVFLKMFTVRPDFQGTGVASWLLYHTLSSAKKLGYTHAEWETTVNSKQAIRFYERIGARRIGEPYLRPKAEIASVLYVAFDADLETVLPKLESDFKAKQAPTGFGVMEAGLLDLIKVSELLVTVTAVGIWALIYLAFLYAIPDLVKEGILSLALRSSIKTLKKRAAPLDKRLAAIGRLSLRGWLKPPYRTKKIVVAMLTDAEPAIRLATREILFQYFRKKYESSVGTGSRFEGDVVSQMENSSREYSEDLAEYFRPYIRSVLDDSLRFVKKRKQSYFYEEAVTIFANPSGPVENRRLAARAMARLLSIRPEWSWDTKLPEVLKDKDAEVRRTAIEAMRELMRRRKIVRPSFFATMEFGSMFEGERTVDIAGVIKALGDTDAEVRQTATLALASAFTVDYTFNRDDDKILAEIEKGVAAGVDIEEYVEPLEDALLYWILEEPFKTALVNHHYRLDSKPARLRELLRGMDHLRAKYGFSEPVQPKDLSDLFSSLPEINGFRWEWRKDEGENEIIGEIAKPVRISDKAARTAPLALEQQFRGAFKQSLEDAYRTPLTQATAARYLYDLKDFSKKMQDARFVERMRQSLAGLYSPYQIAVLYKVALALSRLRRYDVAGLIAAKDKDKIIRAVAEIREEASGHLQNLFMSDVAPDSIPLSRDPRDADEIFGNFYKGAMNFELRADEAVHPWIGEERSIRRLTHALKSDFKNGIRPKGLPVTFNIEFAKSFLVYRKIYWNSFKAGWFKQGIPTLIFMFAVGMASIMFREKSAILRSCMFLGVLGIGSLLGLGMFIKLGEKYGWIFKYYKDELIDAVAQRNWEQKVIDKFIQQNLPPGPVISESAVAGSRSAGFGSAEYLFQYGLKFKPISTVMSPSQTLLVLSEDPNTLLEYRITETESGLQLLRKIPLPRVDFGQGQHQPEQIAVNSKGQIYVLYHPFIQVLNPDGSIFARIERPPNYRTRPILGIQEELGWSRSRMALDAQDNLYVYEPYLTMIHSYDPNGNYRFTIAGPLSRDSPTADIAFSILQLATLAGKDTQWALPSTLAVSPGNELLVGMTNGRIARYKLGENNSVQHIGFYQVPNPYPGDTHDIERHDARSIAVDSQGYIYLLSGFVKATIKVFHPNGKYLGRFGEELGSTAHTLSIDSAGRLFVTDAHNQKISVYKINLDESRALKPGTPQKRLPDAIGFGAEQNKAGNVTFEQIKSKWESAKDGTTLLITDNHAEAEQALFHMPAPMRAAIFRDVKNVIVVLPGEQEKAWAQAKKIARLLKIHEENAHGFADFEELKNEDNLMLLRKELFHFGKEEHLPPIIRHLRSDNNAAIAEWLVWLAKQHEAVEISA